MPNTEALQRLEAALDAQSFSNWWPVLSQLIANCEGWYRNHAGADLPDPAIEEILEVVESQGAELDDAGLAGVLAELEVIRRRASLHHGISWTPYDGKFSDFAALTQHSPRTHYDVLTPGQHLTYLLFGWATYPKNLTE